jgi:exopolyphosphatase/guanosine-5'-triphosphate,3'-diphosphate pyrophosphatase
MRRAAAIDIGTNTVLLTVAERGREGVVALEERAHITRLGANVDERRVIDPAARERTLRVLAEYRRVIAGHGVQHVDAVGTSALRDASADASFLRDAEQALGVRPRVISGSEEAALTFRGGLSGLGLAGPVLVFDIGGGSTEVVLGEAGPTPALGAASSIDLGSVRLFERFVRSDPPAAEELEAIRAAVRRALGDVARPPGSARLVGVAGTVTTLASLAPGAALPARSVHGSVLTRRSVDALATELARLSLSERVAIRTLDAGRADVIPVGAALVAEICAWAEADSLVVSERGVRWGLLEERLGT